MAWTAPQPVWPHTMTCATPSTDTAYSIVAVTPPIVPPYAGTRLPTCRLMNSSPGTVFVNRFGSSRESAQVMNSTAGF